MNRLVGVLLIAGALSVLPSCSTDRRTEEAIRSAQSWLVLVDQGKYAISWDSAASAFQKAVPREQWVSQVGTVRGPLGAVLSREVQTSNHTTSLPGAPAGTYVVIQFATSFENRRGAVETVTPMQEADGSWKVSGYYVK